MVTSWPEKCGVEISKVFIALLYNVYRITSTVALSCVWFQFKFHILIGITGHVRIDSSGDRDADYSILDLDPITGRFEVVAHYYGLYRFAWVPLFQPILLYSDLLLSILLLLFFIARQYISVAGKRIHWPGALDSPPPDVPKCGFLGNAPDCHSKHGNIPKVLCSILA